MSNQWFRLYAELVNEPKVLVLTEALRWRYVALLCLQCNGMYENRPDDEIALSLRVTVEEWEFTKSEFSKRGLITSDNKINGWEKRQYISDIKDPSSAERQKRYRDNKRNARNEPVTSRLPESDTDTETDKKIVKRRVRETVTLAELSLEHNAAWLAEKRSQGKYLDHDESFILEYFKNYCTSKGKRYADHLAGYRNAFEWDSCQPKGKLNGKQTKDDRARAAVMRAAQAGGYAPEARFGGAATIGTAALSGIPSHEDLRQGA